MGVNRLSDRVVLVVEDDPVVLELLREAIAEIGLMVIPVSDGENALHQAAAVRPDLVVLDALLPGIDGFEVCRRLRDDPATRATPVVMVSALPAGAVHLRAGDAACDAFLAKPFEMETLRATVRRLLAPWDGNGA